MATLKLQKGQNLRKRETPLLLDVWRRCTLCTSQHQTQAKNNGMTFFLSSPNAGKKRFHKRKQNPPLVNVLLFWCTGNFDVVSLFRRPMGSWERNDWNDFADKEMTMNGLGVGLSSPGGLLGPNNKNNKNNKNCQNKLSAFFFLPLQDCLSFCFYHRSVIRDGQKIAYFFERGAFYLFYIIIKKGGI